MSRIETLSPVEKLDLTERLIRSAAALSGHHWTEEWELFHFILAHFGYDFPRCIREYLVLHFADLG